MPLLRGAARRDRAHLPPGERLPALSEDPLTTAELHVIGQLTDASNATWLTRLGDPERGPLAVYKPVAGERPLWDFPDGTLAARERAAYLVSELGGWHVIPRTVLRDGPAGPGMVQEWIGSIESENEGVIHLIRIGSDPAGLRPVLRATDDRGMPVLLAHEDTADVRSLAVLDAVLNNTDRKGAHAFRCAGQLYAVDHGVTFHHEPKLRTVLWGWGGKRLPENEIQRLRSLLIALVEPGEQAEEIRSHLTVREHEALLARVDHLIGTGRHPRPDGEWHAIPWPPI
ncbi:Phosphatidylinositol 3-and 4-kinase, catalytic [Nostocoides australiense Ben110]|uniref:Phosphatidylinositol 3-and 4-kinase, catalytic n=1 Tax=Nostocoides australiense Ben110 TaxID=1193182 RepID=W6JWF5_9MICO|nr:SCO1664 family protein [Tetrasphaera australiensis]CCH73096.1 Phosphatidylinositol 3-and 4-kinase, catalytic [Tetrasphaera australiensis Ben110]